MDWIEAMDFNPEGKIFDTGEDPKNPILSIQNQVSLYQPSAIIFGEVKCSTLKILSFNINKLLSSSTFEVSSTSVR